LWHASSNTREVILTTPEEIDIWLSGSTEEALTLQRPLADSALKVVARDEKQDGAEVGASDPSRLL
jgi:putative SOS response-associated peptidase YedK